jgi:LmbE family N-acetylglucosaminyl deacetylase
MGEILCCVYCVFWLIFLPYLNGELDQADAAVGITRLAAHVRRIRPDVVVTFDPSGYYGHPDHVAISQWTTAAVMAAADPTFSTAGDLPPASHQALWGEQTFYRAFSLVNGGRAVETDLFTGF